MQRWKKILTKKWKPNRKNTSRRVKLFLRDNTPFQTNTLSCLYFCLLAIVLLKLWTISCAKIAPLKKYNVPFVVGTKRTEFFIVSWLRLHVAIRATEIFHFIHLRPWTSSHCQQQKKDLYVSRQRVTNALPSARQKGHHPSLIPRRHCDQSCIDQINSVKNEKRCEVAFNVN